MNRALYTLIFWFLCVQQQTPSRSVDGFDVRTTPSRTTTPAATAPKHKLSRRFFFDRTVWTSIATLAATTAPPLLSFTPPAVAAAAATNVGIRVTGPKDGNLPDLPPEAVRSYLQYRIPLQTAADFYIFELQKLLKDPSEYGLVNEFFQTNNSRGGQGNPSRIEREFTNVFRILGLSLPPEFADDIRTAEYRFAKAMSTISKTTAGIRRDLPIEIDVDATVRKALEGWEEGRQAMNEIFTIVNTATGLPELKLIPPLASSTAASDKQQQYAEYGRSERQYTELKKKIKLCQNRGGQTLASAWGNLMVAGTVQDYCSLPDPNEYFYQ